MNPLLYAVIFLILLGYHGFLMYHMKDRKAAEVIINLNQQITQLTNAPMQSLTANQRNIAKEIAAGSVTKVKLANYSLHYNLYGIVDIVAVLVFFFGQSLGMPALSILAIIAMLIGEFTLTYCLMTLQSLRHYLRILESRLKAEPQD